MRLRTKYAVVLLGILLVLGTVVVGSAEFFKQQTIDQEQSDLDQTSELAAGQVGEAINERSNLLKFHAANLDGPDAPESADRMDEMIANSEFFAAMGIDADGRIVTFRGDISEPERQDALGDHIEEHDFIDPMFVQETLQGREQIGSLRERGDDFALTMTAPILDSDANITGAMVGTVSISPETAGATIQQSGFFTALTPLETDTQTVRVTGTTVDGETVTLQSPRDSFDDPLTSTATVESTGWTIEVERDTAALTSQLQFLQFIQFGSLLVVLVSVFGLGYYQYQTTLRQTDELLDGFAELTDGNFEHTVNLEAAEEWNQIGDGFNTMTKGLKQREQQLRERERRLSVLNRVLRHNLQNDLTVVQGYAEMIPHMDSAEKLENASEKILGKSKTLISHSTKARQLETVMENAQEGTNAQNIGRNIGDAASSYRSEYPDAEVSVDGPDDVWVDAVTGIEFGINELVDNAIQHNTSDSPVVEVTVEAAGEHVLITVEDNGPGIPEHEREVLTQDEETSLEHGSGIGLWLVYWAVIKSGGELQFGTQEGGGSATAKLLACEPPADESEETAEAEQRIV